MGRAYVEFYSRIYSRFDGWIYAYLFSSGEESEVMK